MKTPSLLRNVHSEMEVPREVGGLGSAEGRVRGCAFPQVDVVSRGGEKIPVSVWMKKVKQERGPCCVVVLEPVERVSAWVTFQSDVSASGVQPQGADRVSPLPAPLARLLPSGLSEAPPAVPPPHVCSWARTAVSHRKLGCDRAAPRIVLGRQQSSTCRAIGAGAAGLRRRL